MLSVLRMRKRDKPTSDSLKGRSLYDIELLVMLPLELTLSNLIQLEGTQ